ncbi:placental protein 13-like isoform X2 [Callithrix jacchus]
MSSLPVPYKLPVSLSIGSCVIITGRPKLSFLNDPQLEVNFYTGTNEDSDIAFQFRVNFGDCVIMNTREIGMWRCEEKCYNVPFEDGKSFELRICAHYDEYKVSTPGAFSTSLCGLPGLVDLAPPVPWGPSPIATPVPGPHRRSPSACTAVLSSFPNLTKVKVGSPAISPKVENLLHLFL